MIKLEFSLPETLDLVSIQHKYNGDWCVCVCVRLVVFELGMHYATGEAWDLNEACRLAVERCEQKKNAPPPVFHQPPVPTLKGLNLAELDL